MTKIDVFRKMVTKGGSQRIAQKHLAEGEFDEVVAFIEDREYLSMEHFAEAIRARPKGSIWVAELLWNLVNELDNHGSDL